MSERLPTISNNLTTVQAKDRDRQQLQADVEAFLRRRGNRIQRLDQAALGQPLSKSRRQLNQELADRKLGSRAERRRRRQDEEE